MTKVNLPPGCYGFECSDGTKYTARKPGGAVDVLDHHASDINKGQFGQQDFISATGSLAFGTKRGKECLACHRVWNLWNHTCPKCDAVTVPWPTVNEPINEEVHA